MPVPNQYVSSVGYAAVTQWAASAAVTVGQIVRQLATPAVGNERCFRCTTAGTTGATEPAWVLTKSATTSDGTAVWTEITGQEAYQSPGNWAAPFARLVTPTTTTGFKATAGSNIFVASNHSESTAASLTLGNLSGLGMTPIQITSVNSGAGSHVPPLASDVTAGASVATTGYASNIVLNFIGAVFTGLSIIAGSGAGGVGATLSTAASSTYPSSVKFVDCTIGTGATSGGGLRFIAPPNATMVVELVNTTVMSLSTAFSIQLSGSLMIWRDSPNALAGTMPTVNNGLFSASAFNGTRSQIICDGVDFSPLASTTLLLGISSTCGVTMTLRNCILRNRAYVGIPTFNGSSGYGTPQTYTIDATNCDFGGEIYSHTRWRNGDYLLSEPLVVRTGGASDGTTAIGWSILRGQSNVSWDFPFESFPVAAWNTTAGSAVNVTFYGVWNSAALPNNDDIWQDIEYYASPTSTLGTVQRGTKGNFLATGTPLSASTEAWDSGLSARANSTAYLTTSDPVKVASNPGRIFFCVTAGTTAASEPAGYAAATDGGSVTDGTAVFRAGVRFQQTVSVTPQAVGFIRSTIKVAPNTATFYVDPKLAVT